MRTMIIICGVALICACAVDLTCARDTFAARPEYRVILSDDPRLARANELYKEALRWIKDGDSVHEPQRAEEFYHKAEGCLSSAIFELKKSGQEENADFSGEIYYCEKLLRETHSKKGMASRERKYVL